MNQLEVMNPEEIRVLAEFGREPATSERREVPHREPFVIPLDWEVVNLPDRSGPEVELDEEPLGKRPLGMTELLDRLTLISAEEADCIDLSSRGCHQVDIGEILGIDQVAVSFKIRRGLERIRWLVGPGSWFTGEELRSSLTEKRWTSQEVEILALLWENTSQTMVAQALGLTQSKVMHRFRRAFRRLSEDPELDCFCRGFFELSSAESRSIYSRGGRKKGHWNILHAVPSGPRSRGTSC